ncbi:hypothetical protein ACVW0K_000127 [Streptomyces filamentosus]
MTATLTATSADDGCGKWGVRAVARRVEGGTQGVDGLALQAESNMGVDAGGDADVGVAEEFLDHDEVDALFQEQGGGRVAEVVEADAAESCPMEESAEAPGQVGGVEGVARRGGEDESIVRPARSCGLALFLLVFLVALERVDAFGGEGDAAFGGAGLGVEDGRAAGGGALEGAVDAGGATVEVFSVQPEEFAFAEARA